MIKGSGLCIPLAVATQLSEEIGGIHGRVSSHMPHLAYCSMQSPEQKFAYTPVACRIERISRHQCLQGGLG